MRYDPRLNDDGFNPSDDPAEAGPNPPRMRGPNLVTLFDRLVAAALPAYMKNAHDSDSRAEEAIRTAIAVLELRSELLYPPAKS